MGALWFRVERRSPTVADPHQGWEISSESPREGPRDVAEKDLLKGGWKKAKPKRIRVRRRGGIKF